MKNLAFQIVFLCLALISCNGNSNTKSPDSIVGKWELESMDVPKEATDFPEKMKNLQSNLSKNKITWEFDENGKYFTSGIDKPVAENYKIENGKLSIGGSDESLNIFMLNEKRMVLKKEYENSTLVAAFKRIN